MFLFPFLFQDKGFRYTRDNFLIYLQKSSSNTLKIILETTLGQ